LGRRRPIYRIGNDGEGSCRTAEALGVTTPLQRRGYRSR